MYRTDFWTLWEKVRVGCFERTACILSIVKQITAQVGCMRQMLRPGALGRPRGIGWRGRWEGGFGWGIHVTPWLIHVNVWQKPLQCCEVISLQLVKINGKKQKLKKKFNNKVGNRTETDALLCKAESRYRGRSTSLWGLSGRSDFLDSWSCEQK